MGFFQDLSDFLKYNKSERRGISLLVIILLCVLIGRSWWNAANQPQISEGDTKRLDEFIAYIDSISLASLPKKLRIDTARKKDWIDLGLNEWQIDILENYQSKGGQLIHGSDLLKVYGIDSNWYEAVKEYLVSPPPIDSVDFNEKEHIQYHSEMDYADRRYNDFEEKNTSNYKGEKKEVFRFEVNKAKAEDFEKVYGIGAKRASIILNYRNALGGFHSISQIDELYAFPDEVKERLKEHIEIDTSLIQKLSLSKTGFKDFLKHPYLDYFYTKTIFEAASNKGFEIDDLRKLPEISDSLYYKIRPYLVK